MNDTGWGCAYRSLQTCHSWFYLNNKTDKKPPTHLEIQKTLVRLGDKEKSFVNSREVFFSKINHYLPSVSGLEALKCK